MRKGFHPLITPGKIVLKREKREKKRKQKRKRITSDYNKDRKNRNRERQKVRRKSEKARRKRSRKKDLSNRKRKKGSVLVDALLNSVPTGIKNCNTSSVHFQYFIFILNKTLIQK